MTASTRGSSAPLAKQTHTAGPWHAEPWSYENGKRVVTTIQTDKDAITQVYDLWPPDEREEEKQANTNLLLAAPELLEALKLFCDVNPITLHINEVCRRHDVARAAIARAEGR